MCTAIEIRYGVQHVTWSFAALKRNFMNTQRRHVSAGGKFGTDLFHGAKVYDQRSRLLELPKKENKNNIAKLRYLKYPAVLASASKRLFRHQSVELTSTLKHRSLFHVDIPSNPICFLGSTDEKAIDCPQVQHELYKRTRGYAIQLTISGKGNRAYFSPEWPHLMYKGRGRTVDFTNSCLRVQDEVRVSLSKTGFILTVHGYNYRKVRGLAQVIQSQGPCTVYTLSGISYSQIPPIQRTKVRTKKKKK